MQSIKLFFVMSKLKLQLFAITSSEAASIPALPSATQRSNVASSSSVVVGMVECRAAARARPASGFRASRDRPSGPVLRSD